MYLYTAYGLTFTSELELPELTPSADPSAATDVRITVGPVPEHLDEAKKSGVLYEATTDQFLLRIPNVASYLVVGGNQIIVEPAADAPDNDVRVFMLGSGVGALLHQRGVLVLHAAAIGTDAGAVLFAGVSGAGKSTLLGAMLDRGHPMVVDDVCGVVGAGSRHVAVLPGYPRTRLWADAAARLSVETEGLDRTRASIEKFERQLPQAFWDQPSPMRCLYILSSGNRDEFSVTPIPKIEAFAAVLHNTYRRQFIEGLEMQEPHFALASTVASTVRVARVVRPSGTFQLDELADLIEADLETPAEAPDETVLS